MKNQKKGVSRREFLKAASTGVGLAVAAPYLRNLRVSSAAAPDAQARTGILKVGWEPVKNLDPAFIQADAEVSFCNAVYDYLIDITPSAELAPRLAQSWDISKDGLQYTLHLVKGVTFHDGSAFTSADVVWTFNRLRNTDKNNGIVSDASALFTNVADISAPDDLTVVFKLSKTEPDFLFNLSDNHALVLKKDTKDPATTFIGTGAFKVDKITPGDRTTFVANDKYWQPGLPRLAGMEHHYADTSASLAALQGGQIDVLLRMPNARFIALQSDPTLQTVNFPTSGHDILRLRVDQKPGNDPKVVQALKMATNRQEINQIVQLGLGADGRDTPIGPYFKDYFDPNTPLPAFDPAGAKKLLADAGYPDGSLTFDLHVPNTGGRPDFATAIKDQWGKAGVVINIKVEDETTYYADKGWLEVPLGITGWGARSTPQQELGFGLKTGGKWNETHISNPELDKQIDLAGTSLDHDTRVAAYKQIQNLLSQSGPLIVPYFFPVVGAASKNFTFEKGFQAFPGRTDFSTVAVAKK